MCQKVSNTSIAIVDGERRVGDPAVLVANAALAQQELGWKPVYESLSTIVEHAWLWERRLHGDEFP